MAATAGVYEQFGFLFSAKDLGAGEVIKKLSQASVVASTVVTKTLGMAVKVIETTGALVGKLLWKTVGEPFKNVFGEPARAMLNLTSKAWTGSMTLMKKGITSFGETVGDFAANTTISLIETFQNLPGKMKKRWEFFKFDIENVWDATVEGAGKAVVGVKKFLGAGVDAAKWAKAYVSEKEFTWAGIFEAATGAGAKAIKTMQETLSSAKQGFGGFWSRFKADAGSAGVTLQKGLVNGWNEFTGSVKEKTGAVTGKLAEVWAAFKKWDSGKKDGGKGGKGKKAGADDMYSGMYDDMDFGTGAGKKKFGKIRTGLNAVGGLFAMAVTGPIGLALKLLSPLIEMFTNALQPAIETISALFENTFAPLAGILDVIAQSFQPIINDLMGPLTATLELIAVQFGAFMQSLGGAEGAFGPIASLFQSMAPVAQKVFGALTGLVEKILPIVLDLANQLAPIVEMLVGMLADQLVDTIGIIGDLAKDIGPELVSTFIELLKIMLPLVQATLKLTSALLKYVFAPLLKNALGAALAIIQAIAPYLEIIVGWIVDGFSSATESVAKFYGNFSKNMSDLKLLFLDPIIDWFLSVPTMVQQGLVDLLAWVGEKLTGFLSFIGLDGAAEKVGSVFQSMIGFVQSPLEAIKKLINESLVTNLNSILQYDLPAIGAIGKLLGIGEIPKLAEGGIATGSAPVTATFGEAGPEAIIPLRADTFRESVLPIIGDIPALQEMVAILSDIRSALRGTLRVQGGNESAGGGGGGGGGGRSGPTDAEDLRAAVGMAGLAR